MEHEHPWFLSRSELGNPASALARDQPWTEGNTVTPLIHGAVYFDRLADVLGAARSGDDVFLADWRGDDDERLRDGGPSLVELLCGLAERGVHLRGLLWRSHPKAFGFNEEEQTELAGTVNDPVAPVWAEALALMRPDSAE